MSDMVREPDGARRLPTPTDTLMHVNDDGTVTIPADVEVYEVDGHLWLRADRLEGWASVAADSSIVLPGKDLNAKEAVLTELSRQGRRCHDGNELFAIADQDH